MKVIMAAVCSLDGKITSETGVNSWVSNEDALGFSALVKASDAIVMGRKTFDTMKPTLSEDCLRIVMTKSPDSFQSFEGKLEFTSDSPDLILEYLQAKKKTNVLIAGGGDIYTLFLQRKLVHELYITVEPVTLGRGISMFHDNVGRNSFKLLISKTLNRQGTVLLHYVLS